jgi:thiaminase
MPKGFTGSGFVSKTRTPNHPFQKWGRWWSSQEAWEQYAEFDRVRRRRNGKIPADARTFTCTTLEFMEMEKQARAILDERTRHEQRVKRAMQAIRTKYGMHPHTNRHHFRLLYERTGDQDVLALLTLISAAPLNDTQKLQRIRQMFLDEKAPAEILYATAIMCGINLRKKQ